MQQRPDDRSQPYYGQPQQLGDQTPYPGPQPYQPAPPPKKKGRKILLGVIVGFIAIIVIAVAASGGKKNDASAGSGATTAVTITAAAPVGSVQDTQAAAPAPTSQAAAPVQTVTYACTGSAPDGVDITYGAEGSNAEASKLPFTKTVPLSSSAQYVAVQAQLSGSGHVSCTTTVVYDTGGSGQKVTQSGTANGGYNIASAEICSSFDGSWDAC
jgi:hypothetical protein